MDSRLATWGSLLAGDKLIGDTGIATIAAPTVSVSFGSDGFWAENPSLHPPRPRPHNIKKKEIFLPDWCGARGVRTFRTPFHLFWTEWVSCDDGQHPKPLALTMPPPYHKPSVLGRHRLGDYNTAQLRVQDGAEHKISPPFSATLALAE